MLKTILLSVVALMMFGCGAPEFDPPPEPPPAPLFGEIVHTRGTWYGPQFHGHLTDSGETFDMEKMTASHANLPLGTRVEVTNPENGKVVQVEINDRHYLEQTIDLCLSRKAAQTLGVYPKKYFAIQYVVIE
ncbi:septal ring lytic transglycosylase RlpA family protein [Desulfogranum japonicum]|uniref:septal ring lytic transglycosylase RlpA family protein n=1 Tax=Desulfogranum japonicum TaxID=231447 RepID=UPI0004194952|nr:septal ring lytic transglycosylase RlpA family protein [Desulfogranum japonicum]